MSYNLKNHISIGIYTGEGASHSWTWFVETLERLGNINMIFLEEEDIHKGALSAIDLLMIGGGDVFGMAVGLGPTGAKEIERFVVNGGTYLGSCAGAYLVMEGIDLPPYNPFNLIDANMGNYSVSPPPPLNLPHKYKVPYGDGYVYHPAYGPVKVAMEGNETYQGLGKIVAPLYGGPVIIPGEGADILARYLALEKGCFPLVEDDLMSSVLINGCAGACVRKGNGQVYIFGPHFECPDFSDGYFVMEGVINKTGLHTIDRGTYVSNLKTRKDRAPLEKNIKYLREIKGELSNSRIVAFGLERMPVTWTIGTKVWEPEKVRYYIEFAWKRLGALKGILNSDEMEKQLEAMAEGAVQTRMMVRHLKRQIDDGEDTTNLATKLFSHLKHQTVKLLIAVKAESGSQE